MGGAPVAGSVAHGAKRPSSAGLFGGVSEGTRTPDRLDHNQTNRVSAGLGGPYLLGLARLDAPWFPSVCSPSCSPSCPGESGQGRTSALSARARRSTAQFH